MGSVQDIRRLDFDRFRIDIDMPEGTGVYPTNLWIEFTQHRKEPLVAGFSADELELISDQFQEMAEMLRDIDDDCFRKIDDEIITETHPVPEQHPGMVKE